ncbi:hypothetical protein QA584_22755 [Anaerocolumna sp. AGMB13025]|nr:hypothetical protein [Anaerocolumna sp. AGMB13025]WFR56405.1 hypothetical protein QA584_22755 [Anaerocolumna sp. AGMB13025]
MKRNSTYKRSKTEQKVDVLKHYDTYDRDAKKGLSKINPIFTRKPYSCSN